MRNSQVLHKTVEEISTLFPSIYKKYHAQALRRVAGSDLTFRGLWFLKMLQAHGPTGVGEVASFTRLTSSTVSILAKRLERKGLIRRQRESGDERRVDIDLTASGRRLVREMRPPGLEPGVLSMALRKMTKPDREKLLDGLRKLDAIDFNGVRGSGSGTNKGKGHRI